MTTDNDIKGDIGKLVIERESFKAENERLRKSRWHIEHAHKLLKDPTPENINAARTALVLWLQSSDKGHAEQGIDKA